MRTFTSRGRSVAVHSVLALVVAAASIALGLLAAPAQQVKTAGQTIAVGATAPSLSVSGPGELDLFGQALPTTVDFVGPVRPRLVLTHITLGSQVASLFQQNGRAERQAQVGRALAGGWVRFFAWESGLVAAFALLFTGALCGWLRLSWRRTLTLLVGFLLFAEAANLGAVMVAGFTASNRLRSLSSIEELVGHAPLDVVAPAPGPSRPDVQVVVMGDSTAAGVGNAPLSNPSRLDKACSRTAETYAADLARANGWDVLNLACSGATIPEGLLGSQVARATVVPPQLSLAQQADRARAVIVSVGADDLHWSGILRICAATKSCGNQAVVAYFQRQLSLFTPHYYELLKQLALLPSHPRVLVNLYYNPFDPQGNCLDDVGLTPSKQRPLVALLDALNSVLANGARASSFTPVSISFEHHGLCDPQPYVQGLRDPAPFHPNAAGELAIALADERVLVQGSPG